MPETPYTPDTLRVLADEILRGWRRRRIVTGNLDIVEWQAHLQVELGKERAKTVALEAEVAELRGLAREVACCGVSLDLEGIDYVEVQIDRATWGQLRAALPPAGMEE